ncbi:MAG: response regulator, partial [Deltaproteobacteria bacterium]|nr:response regulator [Deltaproteobacteria bacterium]
MNTPAKPLILCIDDYPDNLKLIERFLVDSYNVITADNGPKGLELAASEKPDLILLDIMMPEMDGYEVCSMLQDNIETAYIPVIFLTALGEEQGKAKAFSVGAVDYLVKPVRKDLLVKKVSEYLQTNSRWKEIREDVKSWYERIQSADFIKFKEYLFERLKLDPERKIKFANIPPSRIYSISADIGTSEGKMAQY